MKRRPPCRESEARAFQQRSCPGKRFVAPQAIRQIGSELDIMTAMACWKMQNRLRRQPGRLRHDCLSTLRGTQNPKRRQKGLSLRTLPTGKFEYPPGAPCPYVCPFVVVGMSETSHSTRCLESQPCRATGPRRAQAERRPKKHSRRSLSFLGTPGHMLCRKPKAYLNDCLFAKLCPIPKQLPFSCCFLVHA